MAVFNYKGLNYKGKKVEGFIETDERSGAISLLKDKGIFITEIITEKESVVKQPEETDVLITEKSSITKEKKGFPPVYDFININSIKNVLFTTIEKKPSQTDIATFIRQLASMVKAGIPLFDAINDIKSQIGNNLLKKAVSNILESIKEGLSFSSALKNYPKIFPNIVVSGIEAGEESGALPLVLEKLALYLEDKNALRKKIASALIYPMIMSFVGFIILFYIVVYIVPVISKIFKSMHHALPVPTRIILFISFVLSHYILIILVLFAFVYIYFKNYFKTEKGKLRFDGFLLKIPVFGKFIILKEVNLFSQNLSTLLSSGVIISKAMRVASLNVNNVVLKNALIEAQKSMEEGYGFTAPLESSGLFPQILINMVRAGEKSGNLDEMLIIASNIIKNDIDFYVSSLTQLLEPLMIIVMGFVVGFIVIAIMLPIFEMSSIVK